MTLHYPVRTLIGDYLRGGFGFAVTASFVGFATMLTVIQYIFIAAAIMFAGFLFRTWQRHQTRYELDDIGIRAIGPFGKAIPWSEVRDIRLRYFSTRKDRKSGWFQLTLRGSGRGISVDSNLDGFDLVLERCVRVTAENRLDLREATIENFAAAGHPIAGTGGAAQETTEAE